MSQSLPKIFEAGKKVRAQTTGSAWFFLTVHEVQGDWVLCDYDKEGVVEKDVWAHVPSLAEFWSKSEEA